MTFGILLSGVWGEIGIGTMMARAAPMLIPAESMRIYPGSPGGSVLRI